MLGIYVNEMQRTINGLGHGAGGYYATRITPYGHFAPYHPGAVARVPQGPHVGLGDVPNDFEASVDLQYIPVRQGWYYGYPVDGSGYPDAGLGQAYQQRWRRRRMFGADEAPSTTPTTPATTTSPAASSSAADLERLAKLEKLQTIFQAISTTSIAILASLAVAKAVIAIRRRNFGHYDD